jgi:hypothetical protein
MKTSYLKIGLSFLMFAQGALADQPIGNAKDFVPTKSFNGGATSNCTPRDETQYAPLRSYSNSGIYTPSNQTGQHAASLFYRVFVKSGVLTF